MKKEKKVKEKKVKDKSKGGIKAYFAKMTTEGALKMLAIMFALSLVFSLCSSTLVRLAAIPVSIDRKNAAVNNSNANNNVNNGNQNHGGELPPSVIIPDTTQASIQVQGTTPPSTAAPTDAPTSAPTEKPTESSSSQNSETPAETNKPESTAEPTDSAATIKEKTAILKTFKKVLNTANTVKPGFTKVQYKTLENAAGPLKEYEQNHPGQFVSKDEAEKAPFVVSKFSDMSLFCIENENAACLLDTAEASEAIKSAEKVSQDDGSVKITLVLRDEKDPKVTSQDSNKPLSYTSALFPVEEAETIKKNIEARQGLFDPEIDSLELLYHDCTFELVYMPKTGKIVSITQTAVFDCNTTYKSLGFISGNSTAVFTETSVYSNFIY